MNDVLVGIIVILMAIHIVGYFWLAKVIFKKSPLPRTPPREKWRDRQCRTCGRWHTNPEAAALCGDWDQVVRKEDS